MLKSGDLTQGKSAAQLVDFVVNKYQECEKLDTKLAKCNQMCEHCGGAAAAGSQNPVVVAPGLPACNSTKPLWGKCQPTSFFGFSDSWKQHRVCREDAVGAVVTCDTRDCTGNADREEGLDSISVNLQQGCLEGPERRSSLPAPLCGYASEAISHAGQVCAMGS